jgi:RNA polymerase sigma factor (sigma-70 family)
MSPEVDVSRAELAVLTGEAPVDEKRAAFERLLSLRTGWWGRGTLTAFALGCALACARIQLRRFQASADRADWESIAQESLIVLFSKAHTIKGNPRNWLIGVIRNLTRNSIRRDYQHLLDVPSMEELPDPAAEEQEAQEERGDTAYDTILKAISALPQSQRIVAQMILIDRLPINEIAKQLNLSDVAVRKRRSRAMKSLRDALPELPKASSDR